MIPLRQLMAPFKNAFPHLTLTELRDTHGSDESLHVITDRTKAQKDVAICLQSPS